MEIFILICEIVIGVAGIFTFIRADAPEERVHGLLIISLSLHAVCEHFFGEAAPISTTALILSCALSVSFILQFFYKLAKRLSKQRKS